MSVSLHAEDGAFTIESQSEVSQLVMNDFIRGTGLEKEDFGRWVWRVTPRMIGSHQLFAPSKTAAASLVYGKDFRSSGKVYSCGLEESAAPALSGRSGQAHRSDNARHLVAKAALPSCQHGLAGVSPFSSFVLSYELNGWYRTEP
jgi:hypothetical protein